MRPFGLQIGIAEINIERIGIVHDGLKLLNRRFAHVGFVEKIHAPRSAVAEIKPCRRQKVVVRLPNLYVFQQKRPPQYRPLFLSRHRRRKAFLNKTQGHARAMRCKRRRISRARRRIERRFGVFMEVKNAAVGGIVGGRKTVAEFPQKRLRQRLGVRQRRAVIVAIVGAVIGLVERIAAREGLGCGAEIVGFGVRRAVSVGSVEVKIEVRGHRPPLFQKAMPQQKIRRQADARPLSIRAASALTLEQSVAPPIVGLRRGKAEVIRNAEVCRQAK